MKTSRKKGKKLKPMFQLTNKEKADFFKVVKPTSETEGTTQKICIKVVRKIIRALLVNLNVKEKVTHTQIKREGERKKNRKTSDLC